MLCGCFSFVLRLAVANRINDRGVRIDTELVQEAITCDLMLSDAMSKKAYELTGLENPNSVSQLKTWLEERGIPMDTLGKKDVAQMITELDKNGVDAEALDMLKLRLQMAKSSVKKYQAAERCVCSDGRARGLFQFYGASRTGRYSGRNIQLQNLPQNHISTLDEARTLVKLGCFDMVESIYGNTPDVLSQLIRTMLIPKDGCEFIVADFSAIEARVLAWEAEEQWVLDAFQNGEDLYAGEELRREIEEYIDTNVQDIDDYEKEYDRMERDGERLADHQRSVLCDIRDEVDALDTLLQDTRLNRRRMQGAVRIIQQMINREL